MRVALVHHWLTTMRGGERVLEAMSDIFPDADVFTLFYDPGKISSKLNKHTIHASILDRFPLSSRYYQNLLPLYPMGTRSLKTGSYDLVLSSDSSLIKGVPVSGNGVHVCYCHSPPRYLWNMKDIYLQDASVLKRAAAGLLFPHLRRWDYKAAQRVDHFIANSRNVQKRIELFYAREAGVVYPPVTITPLPGSNDAGDFYLLAGQLVSYKRADLAVQAFNALGKKLIVVGEGPELKRLRKMAGPRIEFLGWKSNKEIRDLMGACRALIFPGEEDFGIVPLEAQSAGRPVIAYGKGGALETVVDNVTGLFFHEQTSESLYQAVMEFEKRADRFEAGTIRENALKFSRENFIRNLKKYLVDKTGLSIP